MPQYVFLPFSQRSMTKNEASDQRAVKTVLFIIVLFACIVGGLVGFFAGWKPGTATLVLLMLPAVAIYRFSGIKRTPD
jgi:quinol-cytochrome oxidoreductase complex cytochrome b subunit